MRLYLCSFFFLSYSLLLQAQPLATQDFALATCRHPSTLKNYYFLRKKISPLPQGKWQHEVYLNAGHLPRLSVETYLIKNFLQCEAQFRHESSHLKLGLRIDFEDLVTATVQPIYAAKVMFNDQGLLSGTDHVECVIEGAKLLNFFDSCREKN